MALRVWPNLDSAKRKALYPRPVCVTHALAEVPPNGLPESVYNESLWDLDAAIGDALHCAGMGNVV